MANWEKHYHLSNTRCFEMRFDEFGKVIRFKIIAIMGNDQRIAVNCETGKRFDFFRSRLLASEYKTLIEIDCDGCNPPKL